MRSIKDIAYFNSYIGIGVAGNFPNHLVQSGELDYFEDEANIAPKGIFPFYLPNDKGFLGINPLSFNSINLPLSFADVVQIEPEIVLDCDLIYKEGRVIDILPNYFSIFNDISIRNDFEKFSMKKNWGKCSEGIGKDWIKIDNYLENGNISKYRLVAFLRRGNDLIQYGEDSSVDSYMYNYRRLLDWTIDCLNSQKDEGLLEDMPKILSNSGFPQKMLLSIGATGYTTFGESNYVETGDEMIIVGYDSKLQDLKNIQNLIKIGKLKSTESQLVLSQKVI